MNIHTKIYKKKYIIFTGASSAVVSAPASVPEVLGSNQAFPRRTKRAFALCQFGGLNEAKTFFLFYIIFKNFKNNKI